MNSTPTAKAHHQQQQLYADEDYTLSHVVGNFSNRVMLLSSSSDDSSSSAGSSDFVFETFDDTFAFYAHSRLKVGDLVPVLFLLLTVANLVATLVCIVYLAKGSERRRQLPYDCTLKFFCVRFLLVLVRHISIMMHNVFSQSALYIKPSAVFCKLLHFSESLVEPPMYLLLAYVWLFLLRQRNLIAFKCVFDDYTSENLPHFPQTTTPSDRTKERMQRNIRWIVKCLLYMALLSTSAILGFSSNVYSYHGLTMCIAGHHPLVFMLYSVQQHVVLFPCVCFTLVMSALLWHTFGGHKDPLGLATLDEREHSFLRYFKWTCVLLSVEKIASIFVASPFVATFLSITMLELVDAFKLALHLSTPLLLIYYERVWHVAYKTFINRGGGGGGGQQPQQPQQQSSQQQTLPASASISDRIFRHLRGGANQDDIDYTNLVDNSGSSTNMEPVV